MQPLSSKLSSLFTVHFQKFGTEASPVGGPKSLTQGVGVYIWETLLSQTSFESLML